MAAFCIDNCVIVLHIVLCTLSLCASPPTKCCCSIDNCSFYCCFFCSWLILVLLILTHFPLLWLMLIHLAVGRWVLNWPHMARVCETGRERECMSLCVHFTHIFSVCLKVFGGVCVCAVCLYTCTQAVYVMQKLKCLWEWLVNGCSVCMCVCVCVCVS